MVTGFDLLPNNKPLQKHWIKRVIAYLIDFIISSVVVYIIFIPFAIGFGIRSFGFFPFTAGVIQVFYSGLLEYVNRKTIGKMVLDLEIQPLMTNLELSDTLIRNFSKVHGFLVLLDVIVGLATEGDPRQKYLDRIAKTTVTGSMHPKHLKEYVSSHIPHPQEEDIKSEVEHRKCRECGGELEDIRGGKARCTECGRIQ
ncbi:MAG: RDD family protein [Candidatus Saliniplasma sp.]